MTARKHLKARIRARMARTGEPYVTARRHVVGEAEEPRLDHGYRLRGGVHPDTSAVANVLADHGVIAGHTGAPLTEAMVLGIGGGLGAGYILWEFEAHGSAHVHLVLGFRNRWQYPARWMQTVLDRLAVPATHHETGGARTAARQLDAALAAGRPALATIDCQSIGYWHLPPELEGYGGYPIVVYAQSGDRVHADDRGLAPLTVPRAQLDAARARVGSYKHRLCVIEPDHPELPVDLLRQAVLAGLADAAEHLASSSDSFGLPAWRKWARMMTATRGAKAWAHVFASGRGLAGALLSTYEGIQPVGLYGGHLRGLYSEFLDEAAGLLEEPRLADAATAWRSAAARWQALAEIALPAEPFGRARELMTEIHAAVIEGATPAPPRPPRLPRSCGRCVARSTPRRRSSPPSCFPRCASSWRRSTPARPRPRRSGRADRRSRPATWAARAAT